MYGLMVVLIWPISKVIRLFLLAKCVLWDNGHVWVKARHLSLDNK